MTRAAFVFVAILSASTAWAQSPATRLTLDEAVTLAVQHNRTLQSAQMQADKADYDLDTARSQRMPQFKFEGQASELLTPIDIHFRQGAFGTFTGVGPVPATDTTITTPRGLTMLINAQAAQPLTQLFRINLGVRMSEASRKVELEKVRSNRLEVVSNVKQLYFAILQTESALDAVDHSITMLREVNRTLDERLLRQVVLKNDALTSSTRLAETEHARLQLHNQLASQKEQLNQLVGRDVRTQFATDGPPAPAAAEVNHESAVTQALEARPDVQQARLRLEQAELSRRIAKTEYIPDVSLAVSYLSPINIEGAPRQVATAGVQLQWEPFDWGRRGREVAARDIEIKQARNAVRDAEDRAVLEVNSAYRRIGEARSRLRVAGLSQESARETARIRANQFQAQAALLSDVLGAEASMADANNDYQQALLALWQAGAEYERALGQDVTK